MKGKTLGILAITALVLAAGAAVMIKSNESSTSGDSTRSTSKSATGKKDLLLPAAREQMGKITKVRLLRGVVETTLEQREVDGRPVWVVASKSGYPADSERVRKMIAELLESEIIEPKTSKPELYERIGVTDPDKPGAAGTLVEVLDAEGKPLGAVILGSVSSAMQGEGAVASSSRYFVRRKGEAQSYLAEGNLTAAAEPMSWVNRTPIQIDTNNLKSATITHNVADTGRVPQPIAIIKEKPEDPSFKLQNKPEGRDLKDDYAATRAAQAIAGISIDDVAPASTVDFTTPDLTSEYRTFDGTIITAKSVTHEGKTWWAFSASYEAPPAPPESPASADALKGDAANAAAEKAKADAAAARETAQAAAKSKADELNKKLTPWAFILPAYKITALSSKLDDLLKPLPAPQAETVTPPTLQPTTPPAFPETAPLPAQPQPAPPTQPK